MKLIRVLSAFGVFICFVLWVSSALASRNSSGTMAGINGPYVAGTVISSSVINARLADIETEITDSASRSGKGGFTAPVRAADGTVTAPAFAFTSETGTGLYRIGSSDLGLAVNQSKKQEWTSTGSSVTGTFAVSGAATLSSTLALSDVLSQAVSGTATTNVATFFEATLADGNWSRVWTGKSTSANAGGFLSFKPNATAANSTTCLATAGQNDTLCVDGNNKTYIGSTGTGITTVNAGSCTLNGGTPATCTATVVSGAKCVASKVQTGGGTAQSVSVTTTTLTVTSAAAGDTAVANYFCWI